MVVSATARDKNMRLGVSKYESGEDLGYDIASNTTWFTPDDLTSVTMRRSKHLNDRRAGYSAVQYHLPQQYQSMRRFSAIVCDSRYSKSSRRCPPMVDYFQLRWGVTVDYYYTSTNRN